jgi:peptide/nickel transport system ATP-binding protein
MSLLSIQSLSLSIHGQSILDCVSMDIGPGEICGVIGESGSWQIADCALCDAIIA